LFGPVCPADIPVFTAKTSLVVLSATAVDDRGRPVRDLRPDEVRIFDGGQPQKLLRFSRGREAGARFLLLVDASGSMRLDLRSASVRMAVLQLLAVLEPGDEVAVASFDERYRRLQPFGIDREAVMSALDAITPFGSTALHDGLLQATEDLASAGDGRRAVVVITDGIDTASRHSPDEVIARSRAIDVPIYAISIVSPLDNPASARFSGQAARTPLAAGRDALRRYAEMSGGVAFTASEFRELKGAVDQIAGEVSFQYRLGYEPPTGPAGFRRVEVRTTRKGVAVRARRGYVPLG
jgi:Ca-activated chloride channel family protein